MILGIHPKVQNATLGGAITTVALWLLSTYAHVNVPGPVADALPVIITFASGWLTPSKGA